VLAAGDGAPATDDVLAPRAAASVDDCRGCVTATRASELSLPACSAGALVTGAVGGGSAARVVVPGRLKFWSSRGPTVTGAGVSVAGGGSVVFWAVLWASAVTGTNHSPPASSIVPKRKPALIAPFLSRGSPPRLPAASTSQCPRLDAYSSTSQMNGAGTPPKLEANARRRGPARCRRPPRSRRGSRR
jgi:hypothetical protein